MSETTSVTFEDGYSRLQKIADQVNSEEVRVHEMCDLYAEAKGLDKALTGYLDEQKGRVEKIEKGEGIQAFRIEAPSDDGAESAGDDSVAVNGKGSSPPATGSDDIPF
ncbi:MAG: exodeoxyribonuclease VII small subunit [Actinomycetota bacterium]|nr:exodeoxyribonuclease VII small subunit [Actinomycetota bacterium]